MKYIPFLFQPEMMRANIDDLKTMTRRIVSKQNSACGSLLTGDGQGWHSFDFNDVVLDGMSINNGNALYVKVKVPQDDTRHRIFCKWEVGDIIWARETFQQTDESINIDPGYVYKATDPDWDTMEGWRWKPSIHMPKAACRLWLQITALKVERVQSITAEDAIAEGVDFTIPTKDAIKYNSTHKDQLDIKSYSDQRIYRDYLFNNKRGDKAYKFPSAIDSFRSLWIKINGQQSWDANPLVWAPTYKKVAMPSDFLTRGATVSNRGTHAIPKTPKKYVTQSKVKGTKRAKNISS